MSHTVRIHEDANKFQIEAADTLSAALRELFPDGKSVVAVSRLLGGLVLTWTHTNRTEFVSNIAMNDKGWTSGLVHVNADGTAEIERPTTYYRKDVAPFRKIKGKSEAEAVAKLIAWYGKNAAAIKALG